MTYKERAIAALEKLKMPEREECGDWPDWFDAKYDAIAILRALPEDDE